MKLVPIGKRKPFPRPKTSKAYDQSVGANSIGRGTGGKEWGISMRKGCLEKGWEVGTPSLSYRSEARNVSMGWKKGQTGQLILSK